MVRKYLSLSLVIMVLGGIIVWAFIVPDNTVKNTLMFRSGDFLKTSHPLTLKELPASGIVNLEPLNTTELIQFGLNEPSPINSPPYTPYQKNGLYWSQPFPLIAGDTVQVIIKSTDPVSWFGVDWSDYSMRGLLATTELDEDGRAFDPQYPSSSSVIKDENGYKLVVNYKIKDDTDCVLVVKNSDPANTQLVSVSVSLKPSVSFRRILKSIPGISHFVNSDSGEGDD